MLITRTELAAKLGVSRARVTQLVNEGMPSAPDGRMDEDAVFAWIRTTCSENSKIYRAVAAIDATREQAPPPRLPADDEASPDPEEFAESFLESLLSGKYLDKAEAERVKENALAGIRTLELRRKAGELIDFNAAKTVFFEQARAYRDALLQWPMSVGPMLAADLDVSAEQVTERLNAYVREFLATIGEPDSTLLEDE
jgi:phage terminase Nu1 subunit (DNA packaging protein)